MRQTLSFDNAINNLCEKLVCEEDPCLEDFSGDLALSEISFLESRFNLSTESSDGLTGIHVSNSTNSAVVPGHEASSLDQLCSAYAQGASEVPRNFLEFCFTENIL